MFDQKQYLDIGKTVAIFFYAACLTLVAILLISNKLLIGLAIVNLLIATFCLSKQEVVEFDLNNSYLYNAIGNGIGLICLSILLIVALLSFWNTQTTYCFHAALFAVLGHNLLNLSKYV